MQKVNYIIIALVLFMVSLNVVNASTYVPTTNLFEGTQTNNLFDLANNQIDNFTSKKFVMFQNDNNYYLVVSDNASVSENAITLTETTIISAIRNTSGSYSYYYDYSTYTEDSTTVNLDFIVISNIRSDQTITGKRFEEYKFNKDIINIGIFVLGIIFAIFITKERKF